MGNVKKFVQAEGDYYSFCTEDGNLWSFRFKKGALKGVPICNFKPEIITEYISIESGNKKRYFEIKGSTVYKLLPPFLIEADEIEKLVWEKYWGADVSVYSVPSQAKKEVINAMKYFSRNIEKKFIVKKIGWVETKSKEYVEEFGERERQYVGLGWQNNKVLFTDNKINNYYDIYIDEKIEVSNPNYILDIFDLFASLIKGGKGKLLFYYAFLCPLLSILKPHSFFPIHLTGQTGQGKTSLAKLMLYFFCNQPVFFTFESTANALLQGLSEIQDSLVLIDDFHPSFSQTQKQGMENALQKVIRAVAEHQGRQRSKADGSLKTMNEIYTGAIITGELTPDIESTLKRCLIVYIAKNDVDFDVYRQLQTKASEMLLTMREFVKFLGNNIDNLLTNFNGSNYDDWFIKRWVEVEKDDWKDREIGMIIYYEIIIRLFWKFLQSKYSLKDINMSEEKFLERELSVVEKAIRNSREYSFEENVVFKVFKVFEQLLHTKKIYLINRYDSTEKMGSEGLLVGYYDDVYYYFIPSVFFNAVRKEMKQLGEYLDFKERQFYQLLDENQFLEKEEKSTTTVRVGEKVIRVLICIRKMVDDVINS